MGTEEVRESGALFIGSTSEADLLKWFCTNKFGYRCGLDHLLTDVFTHSRATSTSSTHTDVSNISELIHIDVRIDL